MLQIVVWNMIVLHVYLRVLACRGGTMSCWLWQQGLCPGHYPSG